MFYRSIFMVALFLLPTISLGQGKLVLKEINFEFQYKDVEGTVADFRSSSEVNMENISDSYFEGSVGVSSLKTGNFLRDWAIKGRKYFNEDEYPRIEFRSTNVSETDEGFKVEGLLTMKDTTKPLVIYFKRTGEGISGTAELFTSDFDISIKKEREENKVLINLEFGIE